MWKREEREAGVTCFWLDLSRSLLKLVTKQSGRLFYFIGHLPARQKPLAAFWSGGYIEINGVVRSQQIDSPMVACHLGFDFGFLIILDE